MINFLCYFIFMISNFVKTIDNELIAYNYYKSNFNTLIIVVHGWFMTKDSKPFLELSEILSKQHDVVTFDCRGHGKSSGGYTFTVDELKDLDAIVQNFKNNYKKIYIIGFSLGAALSIIYATKSTNISKVIAVSPPTDFRKIENNILSPNAFLPTIKKCELKTWFSIRADILRLLFYKKIRPLDVILNLKCPILFMSGEKDPIIKDWHTKKLYDKCLSKKEYISYSKGLHAEDLFIYNKDKFIGDCFDWFNK